MGRIVLYTDYKTLIVEDLQEVWIQQNLTMPGYSLCYKDKHYERNIVYRSGNKKLLQELGQKLLKAYVNGDKEVKI